MIKDRNAREGVSEMRRGDGGETLRHTPSKAPWIMCNAANEYTTCSVENVPTQTCDCWIVD